ncbi:MAG: restriction endonuclease [Thiobacillus sp.]|nr:restriction endonuclease [Thiobacillus sp.]
MTLGVGTLGTGTLGTLEEEFKATFDLDSSMLSQPTLHVVSFFDQMLIARLKQYPQELRTMNRRDFERLVAELFDGFGYEVELTKQTRDGGKDIIAIRRSEVETRLLIECKRPDPGNPIQISAVRELYGVKEDDGASKAILATTTYFTKDARQFTEKHRWELELRDYDAIHQWINMYLKTL